MYYIKFFKDLYYLNYHDKRSLQPFAVLICDIYLINFISKQKNIKFRLFSNHLNSINIDFNYSEEVLIPNLLSQKSRTESCILFA